MLIEDLPQSKLSPTSCYWNYATLKDSLCSEAITRQGRQHKYMGSLLNAWENITRMKFGSSSLIFSTFYRLLQQLTQRFFVYTPVYHLRYRIFLISILRSNVLKKFPMKVPSLTWCGQIPKSMYKAFALVRGAQAICLVKMLWLNSCIRMPAQGSTVLTSYVRRATSNYLVVNWRLCGQLQTTATDLKTWRVFLNLIKI